MTAERRPPWPDRARGRAKMQEVYNFTVDPEDVPGDFVAYTVDNLFGDVWCRPGLSVYERRLMTIGVLATLGKAELLDVHVVPKVGEAGIPRDLLAEAVLLVEQLRQLVAVIDVGLAVQPPGHLAGGAIGIEHEGAQPRERQLLAIPVGGEAARDLLVFGSQLFDLRL